jgi:hypothetical protein
MFFLTDLSVEEVLAVGNQTTTQVLTQVVNRGQSNTAAATLTFRQGAPDGTVLGTASVSAMEPGELCSVSVELDAVGAGEIIYVDVTQLEDENLIGNNSLQAVVQAAPESGMRIAARAGQEEGNLSLEVVVRNTAAESSGAFYIMAATYDSVTGQLLDSHMSAAHVALTGGGSYSDKVTLDVGAGTAWKVMLLDKDLAPIAAADSGTVN